MKQLTDLLEVVAAYKGYIDALPKDLVLPAMPGVDRDWADTIEAEAIAAAQQAQPERAPLTDEQIDEVINKEWATSRGNTTGWLSDHRKFARAIEAAIKQGGQQLPATPSGYTDIKSNGGMDPRNQPATPQVCESCAPDGQCMNRRALCSIMLNRPHVEHKKPDDTEGGAI